MTVTDRIPKFASGNNLQRYVQKHKENMAHIKENVVQSNITYVDTGHLENIAIVRHKLSPFHPNEMMLNTGWK